jgi:hypothetical protein
VKYYLTFFILFSLEAKTCDPYLAHEDMDQAIKDGVLKIEHKNDGNLGPVRDQDSVGVCYAYSSADLLEHWLKKTKQMPSEQNISAIAMSLQYAKEEWQLNSPEFEAMAIKKDALQPKIDEIDKKILKLNEEEGKIDKKIEEIQTTFSKDHPRFKELQTLKEKVEELYHNKDGFFADDPKIIQMEELQELILKDNQDYIKATAELLKEKDKIMEKSSHLGRLYESLSDITMKENDAIVPGGGWSAEAIEMSWDKLCYESEVSSRNIDLSADNNIYQDSYRSYSDISSIHGALRFIMIEPQRQAPDQCALSNVIQQTFPGSSQNSWDLLEIMSKVSDYPYLLEQLMKVSCKQKKFSKKPELEKQRLDPNAFSENEPLFKQLDQSLEKGNIASISYRSQILERKNNKLDAEDLHASVIVGSANLCGEKFYAIRNSYGADSCKNMKKSFTLEGKDQESYEKLMVEFDCHNQAQIVAAKRYPNCDSGLCSSEVQKAVENYLTQCLDKMQHKLNREVSHPFFCDKEGNFYVKKEQLKKGLFDVTTIAN